jgi:arsenite methyltransferase
MRTEDMRRIVRRRYARSDKSLGCGNPVQAADLKPGEIVVDLGSGAGFDISVAARAVGPSGRVIGIDMTPEMIERARHNISRQGLTNVTVVLGEIEALPLSDTCADVILSNCVINLSPDKPRVFREAHRVLRPHGRVVVSDILARRLLPRFLRANPYLWSACIAGAATERQYTQALRDAGFTNIEVSGNGTAWGTLLSGCCTANLIPFFRATVRATKP